MFGKLSVKYAEFLYQTIIGKIENANKQRIVFMLCSFIHYIFCVSVFFVPYFLISGYYIAHALQKFDFATLNAILPVSGFLCAFLCLVTREAEYIIEYNMEISSAVSDNKTNQN